MNCTVNLESAWISLGLIHSGISLLRVVPQFCHVIKWKNFFLKISKICDYFTFGQRQACDFPLLCQASAKLINCLLWSLYLVNTDMRFHQTAFIWLWARSSIFSDLDLTDAETVEDLTRAQPRNTSSSLWSFECSEFVSIWSESCELDYRTWSSVRLQSAVLGQPLWYWSFKRSWTLKASSQ